MVNWSFLDVRFVQTRQIWNSVMLGGAVAGLAAAILAPFFAVGLPLGILIFAGAALVYVKHRNAGHSPPDGPHSGPLGEGEIAVEGRAT